MSLKQEVRDWLLKKVFRDKGRPKAKKAVAAGSNPFVWSVLVLDSTTLRIVQSCFQGYELGVKEVGETRCIVQSWTILATWALLIVHLYKLSSDPKARVGRSFTKRTGHFLTPGTSSRRRMWRGSTARQTTRGSPLRSTQSISWPR